MICVSNHPTSFIEPCLMACYLPITFHFLVRGDLFSKKWLNWLLVGTNQIPIFRRRDGLDNVKKNLDTQERLKDLFQKKKVLLMFPEASTEEHMYLRPLKKGVARFAFMNDNVDLQILPLGINYHWSTPFNSEVTICIGDAIQVDDFASKNYETEASRINALMKEIRNRMQTCVRHIEDKSNESFLYKLFSIQALQNQSPLIPFRDTNDVMIKSQKGIIDSIENDETLLERGIDIAEKYVNIESVKPTLFQPFIMLFFAPLFLLGFAFQLIPITVANTVVKKKIKSHEFKVSVFCAVWLVMNLAIGILALLFSIMNVKILMYYLIFAALGIFSFYYLKAYSRQWKYFFQSKKQKRLSDEMMQEDLQFLLQ